jgi:hypothetical protein
MIWKFDKVPSGFWKDVTNQRKYFDWLRKRLGIQDMESWYKVSLNQIESEGGMYSGLLL